jgi:SAM-dependent methyltransferase
MIINCPICKGFKFKNILYSKAIAVYQFIERDTVPKASDFYKLDIVQCALCSHVFNRGFDVELGEHMYGDTPLSNILVHVSMVKSLEKIASMIGYDVFANKKVIEIGAGTGHLARIIARDADEVTIYEPCLGLKAEMLLENNITLWNKNFTSNLVTSPVDFIICRQVIEHLGDPCQMLSDIALCLRSNGMAYLEVPRAEYIFENAAIGDFHFAHVHYFTKLNFVELCRQCGLQLIRSFQLKNGHDAGFLFIRSKVKNTSLTLNRPLDIDFKKKLSERQNECRFAFERMQGDVAFYGATRNGQAVLDLIGDLKRIYVAYDDNIEYAGFALYNINQVVPIGIPDSENLFKVSNIIITSYLHQYVIAEKLRLLGFRGRIITASPAGCLENKLGMEGLFGTIHG